MVSVFGANAVNFEFEPRSGQTRDNNIGIYCFSAKHVAINLKKTRWFGISIVCPNGATCLPVECCFSELALAVKI